MPAPNNGLPFAPNPRVLNRTGVSAHMIDIGTGSWRFMMGSPWQATSWWARVESLRCVHAAAGQMRQFRGRMATSAEVDVMGLCPER